MPVIPALRRQAKWSHPWQHSKFNLSLGKTVSKNQKEIKTTLGKRNRYFLFLKKWTQESIVLISKTTKQNTISWQDTVIHACFPSTQETELQGPLYEASLGYMLRPCLKAQRNKTNLFFLEGWRVLLNTQPCVKYNWDTSNGISILAFLTIKRIQ